MEAVKILKENWTFLLALAGSVAAAHYLYQKLQTLQKPAAMPLSEKQSLLIEERKAANKFQGFDDYELSILSSLIVPDDIDSTFDAIGGLEQVKDGLRQNVILPLERPDIFMKRSNLLGLPKGILLYGPPGTGKTMLAKAIAKESRSVFLNIQKSDISSKWYGEPSKLVAALFSVATKLQPCIIFIDEMEAMFRTRDQLDHEASLAVKCQFMALWDGLMSTEPNRIMIIGATNRPSDIDPAILRRMPRMFLVPLPNYEQRLSILKVILRDEQLDTNVSLNEIAQCTEGLSGSDLKHVCRLAAEFALKDFLAEETRFRKNQSSTEPIAIRAMNRKDFLEAVQGFKQTRNQVDQLEFASSFNIRV